MTGTTKAANSVPTEPGTYFDLLGGRWELTREGEWLDCHGRSWAPNPDAPAWLDQTPSRDLFVEHLEMRAARPTWPERLSARMTLPGWRYYRDMLALVEAAGWARPNAARSPIAYYWRFGPKRTARKVGRAIRHRWLA